MKKVLLAMMVFLVLFVGRVMAQEQGSDESYQDLLKNYRTYQALLEVFNTQKSQYLTYQTVESQAELLSSSKNLILTQIDSLTAYATFVKSLLAEATKVLNYKENYLYVMLDEQIAYLESGKNKVLDLSSFTAVNEEASDLQSHYQKISNFGYQSKASIELAGASKILANIKIETDKIKNLLEQRNSDEARVLAAKEKVSGLEKEIREAEDLLNQASNNLKNFTKDQNYVNLSQEIRRLIDQAVEKFSLIVAGEKDIVFSLK